MNATYEAALDVLREAGVDIVEVDFSRVQVYSDRYMNGACLSHACQTAMMVFRAMWLIYSTCFFPCVCQAWAVRYGAVHPMHHGAHTKLQQLAPFNAQAAAQLGYAILLNQQVNQFWHSVCWGVALQTAQGTTTRWVLLFHSESWPCSPAVTMLVGHVRQYVRCGQQADVCQTQ